MTAKRCIYYINEKKPSASSELAHLLKKCISKTDHPWEDIIFICIGSDRITGDSLGPLIGHQLSRQSWKNIHVYGTLDYPVHALNLEQTMKNLLVQKNTWDLLPWEPDLSSRVPEYTKLFLP